MSLLAGTFANFHNYFKDFADTDADVKFFMYGGVEKGYHHAANDKDFDYPFLWLEEPQQGIYFNSGSQWVNKYSGGISCTAKAEESDPSSIIQALTTTQNILFRLQKKLIASERNHEFIGMEMGFDLEEVDPGWAQNHRGWRLSFVLHLDVSQVIYNS